MDEAWALLFRAYEEWRHKDIDDVAPPYLQRPRSSALSTPLFDTPENWACMLSKKPCYLLATTMPHAQPHALRVFASCELLGQQGHV